jgi:hypothetical protein
MAGHEIALQEPFASSTFRHSPLSREPGTIRLLRILPALTDNGLVQCELWQATTDAEYTCLSYQWGSADDDQELIINGKSFPCRRNLSDFLHMARTKHVSTPLWIDAICIDQESVADRNRQVSQMGQIYFCAQTVLIWLGCSAETARFLSFMSDLIMDAPSDDKAMPKYARTYWYRARTKEIDESWLHFASNQYWTRAWITQELLLARSLRMMADTVEVGTAEMKVINILFLPVLDKIVDKIGFGLHNKAHLIEIYLKIMAGDKRLDTRKGSRKVPAEGSREIVYTMMELLFILRGRECEHPRDKVYSIRSVAADGEKFVVDYEAPEVDCLLELLRSLRSALCFCSLTFIVQDVLRLGISQIIPDPSRYSMIKLSLGKHYLMEIRQTRVLGLKRPPVCSTCAAPVNVDCN